MANTTVTSQTEWEALLRHHGLRATAGRVAALAFLEANPHESATTLYASLNQTMPTFTLQSAHNIVRDLTSHGLLNRIDVPGSDSALFETRVNDNHHHAVCIKCGAIKDIDCVIGEAPCLHPEETYGMQVLEASVTFRGICRDCQ